jgi:molybdate transport system substrate-binding protein
MRIINTKRCLRRYISAALLSLTVVVSTFCVNAQDNVTRIAAASSMRFVLDDLIQAYVERSGDRGLQAVYGSSGNLYRQIVQGAPYDLFLSADEAYTTQLLEHGRSRQTTRFTTGTLVLHGACAATSASLPAQLRNAVDQGKFEGRPLKIAIANPTHAPFGRAARQAIQSYGLWDESQPYLIIADSVSQAAQFASTGAVSFAFIAQSLSANLAGQSVVVPPEYYSPLLLNLALLSDAPGAAAFQAFVGSAQAQSLIRSYKLNP